MCFFSNKITVLKIMLYINKMSTIAIDDALKTKHCEKIYENLAKNADQPFFQKEDNKPQIIAQLKQQIDYIYAKRYGKKRIG